MNYLYLASIVVCMVLLLATMTIETAKEWLTALTISAVPLLNTIVVLVLLCIYFTRRRDG